MRALKTLALLTSVSTLVLCGTVSAQAQQSAASWGRAYGQGAGQTHSTYVNRHGRDANGNRVVLNGVIQSGVGVQASAQARANAQVSGGVGASGTLNQGSALAVGNQLNVNVVGNYNTVIVNSNQINNGDINANNTINGKTQSSNDN